MVATTVKMPLVLAAHPVIHQLAKVVKL